MGRSAGSIGAAAHAGQPVVVGRDLPDPGVGDDFIADPGISPVGVGTPGVIALDERAVAAGDRYGVAGSRQGAHDGRARRRPQIHGAGANKPVKRRFAGRRRIPVGALTEVRKPGQDMVAPAHPLGLVGPYFVAQVCVGTVVLAHRFVLETAVHEHAGGVVPDVHRIQARLQGRGRPAVAGRRESQDFLLAVLGQLGPQTAVAGRVGQVFPQLDGVNHVQYLLLEDLPAIQPEPLKPPPLHAEQGDLRTHQPAQGIQRMAGVGEALDQPLPPQRVVFQAVTFITRSAE